MTKDDKLFELIKSLDRNEKGYFKKNVKAAAQKESTKYLKLFEEIDKLEVYDEENLYKRMRQEFSKSHFANAKNYLYHTILRQLRSYHEKNSAKQSINAHLENVDILFHKGLREAALEANGYAAAEAEAIGDTLKILDSLITRRVTLFASMESGWRERLQENVSKTERILHILLQENHLYNIYTQFLSFVKTHRHIRNEEQRQYIENLFADPVLKQDRAEIGFSAQVNYFMIFKLYYQLQNQDNLSVAYMLKVLDLYDQNLAVRTMYPMRYVAALNNFFGICMKIKNYDKIEERLEKTPPDIVAYDKKNNYYLYEYQLSVSIIRGNFAVAQRFNQEISAHFIQRMPDKSRGLLLAFNSIHYHYILGEYEAGLDKMNTLLEMKTLKLRVDAQAAARIIHLILLYETKNILLLESTIRAVRHFLKTRTQYYETEQRIVAAIAKLTTIAHPSEERPILEQLLTDIRTLADENPMEKNFQYSCDVFYWLIAKVEQLTPEGYLEKYVVLPKNKGEQP